MAVGKGKIAALAAAGALAVGAAGAGVALEDSSTSAAPQLAATQAAAPSVQPLSGGTGQYAATFHWGGVTEAGQTGYYVYQNGTQVADVPTATYTFTNLACGTTFTFGVAAHDGSTTPISTTSYSTPSCGTGSCPSATLNTPDGPDPWGGCFPGPLTTGVPTGTTLTTVTTNGETAAQAVTAGAPSDNTGWSYSSSQTALNVNSPTAVVDGISTGGLNASGSQAVTIKNSNMTNHINLNTTGTSSVTHSTINGGSDTNWDAIDGYGKFSLTIDGNNISGGGHGILCYSNCAISNNYINNLISPSGGAHQNPILLDGGSNNTVTHNTVHCIVGNTCTSELTLLDTDGNQINETMTKNLIMATGAQASFCIYPGPNVASPPFQVSGVTWQNNVIQKGSNGHCDSSNGETYSWFPGTCSPIPCIWTGNMYDDGTTWNP